MSDVDFVISWREVQKRVHTMAREKGFWDSSLEIVQYLETQGLKSQAERVILLAVMEKLLLTVSELGEAAEGLRHGNPPDDKIPQYSSLAAELADTIIRIMDLGQFCKEDLGKCIIEKMAYNSTRERLHGKMA